MAAHLLRVAQAAHHMAMHAQARLPASPLPLSHSLQDAGVGVAMLGGTDATKGRRALGGAECRWEGGTCSGRPAGWYCVGKQSSFSKAPCCVGCCRYTHFASLRRYNVYSPYCGGVGEWHATCRTGRGQQRQRSAVPSLLVPHMQGVALTCLCYVVRSERFVKLIRGSPRISVG